MQLSGYKDIWWQKEESSQENVDAAGEVFLISRDIPVLIFFGVQSDTQACCSRLNYFLSTSIPCCKIHIYFWHWRLIDYQLIFDGESWQKSPCCFIYQPRAGVIASDGFPAWVPLHAIPRKHMKFESHRISRVRCRRQTMGCVWGLPVIWRRKITAERWSFREVTQAGQFSAWINSQLFCVWQCPLTAARRNFISFQSDTKPRDMKRLILSFKFPGMKKMALFRNCLWRNTERIEQRNEIIWWHRRHFLFTLQQFSAQLWSLRSPTAPQNIWRTKTIATVASFVFFIRPSSKHAWTVQFPLVSNYSCALWIYFHLLSALCQLQLMFYCTRAWQFQFKDLRPSAMTS